MSRPRWPVWLRVLAKARVFFALWPDADTAAVIDQAADVLGCGGRRIKRERLHLTLAFIGLIEQSAISDLCYQAVAVPVPPFTLVLDRIGYFKKPQLLWLGSSSTPPELTELAAAVSGLSGASAGNAPASAFRPHVSLARRAKRPNDMARVTPIKWRVREFCLVESGRDGTPGGYSVQSRWRLG